MPVYSTRCYSTASSDIAPVMFTGSTSENQSLRVWAMSSMDLAWYPLILDALGDDQETDYRLRNKLNLAMLEALDRKRTTDIPDA
jgi:hypothetical protein